MVGGILVALVVGRNDPGFVHNGALAGLVAVCAGSDVMHPIGSLIVGGVAGGIFVIGFEICQNKLKIDDVLGVWPLHGIWRSWVVSPPVSSGSRPWVALAVCLPFRRLSARFWGRSTPLGRVLPSTVS